MTDDAPAVGGAGRNGAGTRTQDGRAAEEKRDEAAEKDRIARGAGVQDQIGRSADVREQNRLNAPGPGRIDLAVVVLVAGWTPAHTRSSPSRRGEEPGAAVMLLTVA